MDRVNGYDVCGHRLMAFTAPGEERDDKGSRRNEVTTDEAAKLACVGPAGCGIVTAEVDAPTRTCLGDGCMAWRFGAPLLEKTVVFEVDMLARRVRRIGGNGEDIPIPLRPTIDEFRPEGEGWELRSTSGGNGPLWYERLRDRQGYCAFVPR